jgi:hypothetical protein
MRAFWGTFSSNRHKCNSEIQDPKFGHDVANDVTTSRRREQWRDNVTPTGAMTSLGSVIRRSTICMTSLRFNDIFMTMHRLYHMAGCVIQSCDPEKYHTVGLNAWQRQKFDRNVRIIFFSRVWNRFQWCSTDRSQNYLGFWDGFSQNLDWSWHVINTITGLN